MEARQLPHMIDEHSDRLARTQEESPSKRCGEAAGHPSSGLTAAQPQRIAAFIRRTRKPEEHCSPGGLDDYLRFAIS